MRHPVAAIFIALIAVSSSADTQVPSTTDLAASWGRFVGTVETRWEDDGRRMTLLRDFAYVEANGTTHWDAPKASVIDGASIPKFAWSIVGGPFEGKYRNASVVHDVACVTKARPWKTTHRMFYSAERAGGTGALRAKIMYAAVYHFGPRWPDPKVPEPYALRGEDDLARLRQFIDDRPNVSLDEIDQLTSARLRAAEPQIRPRSRRPPTIE